MSVATPPRNRPVFDPITGAITGYEPNPDFYAFFGLGPGFSGPGTNTAGLGAPNGLGGPTAPYTDIGVPTGVLFDQSYFPFVPGSQEPGAGYDAYLDAREQFVPDYFNDPITGQVDAQRGTYLDYRGRPNDRHGSAALGGLALQNWARNNPQEAAAAYWSMTPEGLPAMTAGEQRMIALTIGPELIEDYRLRSLAEVGALNPETGRPYGYTDPETGEQIGAGFPYNPQEMPNLVTPGEDGAGLPAPTPDNYEAYIAAGGDPIDWAQEIQPPSDSSTPDRSGATPVGVPQNGPRDRGIDARGPEGATPVGVPQGIIGEAYPNPYTPPTEPAPYTPPPAPGNGSNEPGPLPYDQDNLPPQPGMLWDEEFKQWYYPIQPPAVPY